MANITVRLDDDLKEEAKEILDDLGIDMTTAFKMFLSQVVMEHRELHIESDWLLIYKINNHELELYLMTLGSHDEIFRKAKDINS